ncbi:uncharacterized protein LOC108874563 isoform X4 [Lates calcarifer]|uniref:Uncharacterized protein LOC108874563 isoform X4 n=1 Tax=Lates calcarifer TaxID=8187 RepID=A0AAJ7PD88_LATCA|nr:uncharacterized protein LOC108874563 isoform X4 [Lates calcarifer]
MILTLINGTDMDPETVAGVGNLVLSKAELLRVVVTEKLTAAAQEILAVVDRIVAGYEEEASGFRQEIDRQKRQLEVLLQPEIKVEETDDQHLFPISEPIQEEAPGGGGELPEEEQQQKYELNVEEDRMDMGLRCYTEEEMDEDEEMEESSERPEVTSTQDQDQDHLSEPDYESRLPSPRVQSDLSAGRRRSSEPQGHMDLKLCILEDSQIELLSPIVYKKYPLQELQCPRGLQEAEFLNLLKSTFPQLAADKPFSFLMADRRRKLQPLNVKTLTPEEISRAIRRSALYIQLKTPEEPQTTDEEFHSSQGEDTAAAADSPSTPDQTRSLSLRVKSDRIASRRRFHKPEKHVNLRVCIMEDSEIEVSLDRTYKKYPLQELQCPRGLQEAEFLNLLRFTFPQLETDKPFDIFTADRKRKLQPLNVKTLTPEQICRANKRSVLYIRLKTQEKPQTTDEEFHSSQKEDAAAADSPSTPDRTSPSVRLLLPRVQLDRMMADRNRVIEPRSHIDLRIHILDHSQDDVLSNAVFKKFPSEKLKCPRGLQEAEFLNLLRSTFPQLAADKPFEFLKTNRSKRLQPLNVKTVIPEEISRAIGHSSLYIRLKPFEELEKDPPQQKKDAATKKSPSTPGQTRLNTSVQPDRRKTVGPQISDVHNHVNLRIRILEDPRINVLNVEVFQKYPLQELRCPSVLKEPEFLDLLRSTFPQLADDKPFDVLITDRSRKLRPLDVKTLTPQEISRTLGSIMNNHIYFRLKSQEEAQASAEKLHLLQRKVDEESPSTSGQSRLQTSRVHRKTSQDIETGSGEEDSERERSPNVWNIQSLLLSDSEKEEESGEEVVDGDDDWKPNRGVASLMNKEPEMAETSQQPKRSGVQANRLKLIRRMLTSNHDPLLSCKVCGAPRTSMNMLIKHSWSHVDDTEKLCGICGQNSDSADELRNHLQSHQKTRSCHICRKSFLTSQGLRGHIARHTGDKPHVCNVCHKAFPEKSALSIHMWTHSADKPHKCDVCQKSFLKKINLEHHRATHSAEKLYNCSVCMKTFKSHEHVSQHMLIHSSRPVRESKYTCEICSKRFYTNQKLQFHLSSHTSELRSHRHSTPRRNPPAAWPSVRASL